MQDFIMGNGYYSVVTTVLLVVNFEGTGAVKDSCADCPAGTFCEKDTQVCSACPSNSFSSTGGQRTCDICRLCEGIFKTKKACSRTSNAECECIPGFHCLDPGCTMCQEDCKKGQEFTNEGCEDCGFGKFNDQKNGVCRPWKNCSLDGRTVLVNGTKERDVVCGPSLADFSPGTSPITVTTSRGNPGHVLSQSITFFLAVTSAAVVFLVVFLMFRFLVEKWNRKKLLFIFKQPFIKPVQTAQEEDASSCRFPEEEEGDYEL
ncbi:tumor necrosis factor receptor superfamily member 9 [Rhynchocyon petersi]